MVKFRIKGRATPAEDSIALRVVVAVAVEVAIVAVVSQPQAVAPLTAIAAVILAPAGYLFSYRRRSRSSVPLKVLLSFALLAALGQFMGSASSAVSVDQTRLPLATLFLWVQVLHAFDVPRRRDLAFSMVSSLILMAEAASLSLSSSFLVFLVPWMALSGAWLSLSARPRPDQVVTPVAIRRTMPGAGRGLRAPMVSALTSSVVAVLAASLVFLAMPRLPGTFVRTPPFSLAGRAAQLSSFDGGVQNPGLADPGDGVVDFSADGYPGFSDVLDLRARGRLSDELVFRVRAPHAALWRAEVFDTYDGSTWTMGDETTVDLRATTDGVSMQVPFPIVKRNMAVPDAEVRMTQTFYLEEPQPNVLFGASAVTQVYFPAGGLKVDRAGSIRSPILLDEGLVYSVDSILPVLDTERLEAASGEVPGRLAPYLQLPEGLPDRVGALANSITTSAGSTHAQVLAVQSWLRANTRYNLDIPRDPEGVDAVDHFLFETREGFCEQIASSMAIMLRTLGIPTRVVTGYGPGERNPFTGYFEVKQSDAHAWLEVWYPGVGWVQYDPTFGVPQVASGFGSRFMAGPVFAAVGRFFAQVVPEPVKRAIGTMVRTVGSVGRLALSAWPWVVALAVLGATVAWVGRRRRSDRRHEPDTIGEAAFVELVQALAPLGHVRGPSETAAEFLQGVEADEALDDDVVGASELVVRTYERERFGSPRAKPTEAEALRARAAAAQVRHLVGRH
ncbi:MAG TPA: transglutaminaseTgpA domain-containing protein [Actinomycetota bacterium]